MPNKPFPADSIKYMYYMAVQIFTHRRAGSGKPIGEQLLTNPNAYLPFEGLEWSEAVQSNVTSLARRCGAREISDRPEMDEVSPHLVESIRCYMCIYM